MKILIIEDDTDVLKRMKSLLEEHSIEEAHHLREAMLKLKNLHKYDLIICDHYFPKFVDSSRPDESGTEVFFECNYLEYKGNFLHHSADPCPEKYNEEIKQTIKFHSIKKYCPKTLLYYVNSIKEKK